MATPCIAERAVAARQKEADRSFVRPVTVASGRHSVPISGYSSSLFSGRVHFWQVPNACKTEQMKGEKKNISKIRKRRNMKRRTSQVVSVLAS